MNARDSADRRIGEWFAASSLTSPHMDVDRILVAVTATDQRRGAASLPGVVVDFTVGRLRQVLSPRALMVLGAAALVVLAVATLITGMRPRLPAPFGPAATGLMAYAVRDSGIVVAGPLGSDSKLVWTGAGSTWQPSWSPDGRYIAFVERDVFPPGLIRGPVARRLIVIQPDGTEVARLDLALGYSPPSLVWAPGSDAVLTVEMQDQPLGDGAPLAFATLDPEAGGVALHLHVMAVRLEPGQVLGSARWSPDGARLYYSIVDDSVPNARSSSVQRSIARDGTDDRLHETKTAKGDFVRVRSTADPYGSAETITGGYLPTLIVPDGSGFLVQPIWDIKGDGNGAIARSNDGDRFAQLVASDTDLVLVIGNLSDPVVQARFALGLSPDPNLYHGVCWSPDDRWVAVETTLNGGSTEVAVVDAATGARLATLQLGDATLGMTSDAAAGLRCEIWQRLRP